MKLLNIKLNRKYLKMSDQNNFYTDLEQAVMDTVCLNFNTSVDVVLEAVIKQFDNSDMIEDIVCMAQSMYEEIINDLQEFHEDEVYIN